MPDIGNVFCETKIYGDQKTLISSSCISRNSSFLLLSETEGRPVPSVLTTESGREEIAPRRASTDPTLSEAANGLTKCAFSGVCDNIYSIDWSKLFYKLHLKFPIFAIDT